MIFIFTIVLFKDKTMTNNIGLFKNKELIQMFGNDSWVRSSAKDVFYARGHINKSQK